MRRVRWLRKAQKPSSLSPSLANFTKGWSKVRAGFEWSRWAERARALTNLLGSHSHLHSDSYLQRITHNGAIAQIILLTDVSYLLHHISSPVISRCINISTLSLRSSFLLVWVTCCSCAVVKIAAVRLLNNCSAFFLLFFLKPLYMSLCGVYITFKPSRCSGDSHYLCCHSCASTS